jgi:hypothetical protein
LELLTLVALATGKDYMQFAEHLVSVQKQVPCSKLLRLQYKDIQPDVISNKGLKLDLSL